MIALFCYNASWTGKMRLLVIGKSVNRQGFRNAPLLPCDYQANMHARMRDLFNEWLRKVGKRMKGAKCNILWLINSRSAHNTLRFGSCMCWVFLIEVHSHSAAIWLGYNLSVKAHCRNNSLKFRWWKENKIDATSHWHDCWDLLVCRANHNSEMLAENRHDSCGIPYIQIGRRPQTKCSSEYLNYSGTQLLLSLVSQISLILRTVATDKNLTTKI